MKLDFEKLLNPVSEEKPCGNDISGETDFYMLEEMAKGKQETQFSEAIPPNWNEVLDLALSLFSQSKDLWVAYYILCSTINLYGDAGMVKGLEFLTTLTEKYWETLYPELDKDSDELALQRINIIKDLFSIHGVFASGIRNITLTKTPIGSLAYKNLFTATKENKIEIENSLIAAIIDSNKEFIENLKNNFIKARESATKLKNFLSDKGISSDFESAYDEFTSMLQSVESYLNSDEQKKIEENASEQVEDGEAKSHAEVVKKSSASSKRGINGEITNHQDIVRLLKKICKWYEDNEPSSPVPLFIKRAECLIGKNFVDIVNNVASSAMNDISYLFNLEEKKKEEKIAAAAAAATTGTAPKPYQKSRYADNYPADMAPYPDEGRYDMPPGGGGYYPEDDFGRGGAGGYPDQMRYPGSSIGSGGRRVGNMPMP